MSTSRNTVFAFILSLSEFACLVSEQHYRFLSQSLNDLEHQIEQHRVERHLMELRIANLQQQTTQWCPDPMSTSSTSRTPSLLSDIKSGPHRQSFNNSFEPLFTQHFDTRLIIRSKRRSGIKPQNDQHGIKKEPDLRSQ